ncbi:thiamine-phosphate diphosphorylase [Pseudopedobacter saltans DSM 12145]|uniref:Thiamine-phosphate diphosphorylase n=1 Tax=Pseudopedobacter saltans (strain ATCC 51119 / DSM 12145 / JCM 21818 / CCUG 39354 / LMG 10337 / NBRC 100064 / NCIMB 13643) TaxID=762903 RepID=F0SER0_PSESL|nr:thiamine phosphate synthase [Pseudopedobacter saltans]ADY51950.1 thiamine-phosphate diphosphorylase [Pseudopedobacter saltans DSM 12145]
MKIIVISSPELFTGESDIVNALFDEGLELFHFRKPGLQQNKVGAFFEKIRPQYLSRIVLHEQHELAVHFEIKRLHFPEKNRRVLCRETLLKLKADGFTLSSSLHQLKDIEEIATFHYALFGPVFNSISKPDYLTEFNYSRSLNNVINQFNIIGLGGLSSCNYKTLEQYGFKGAAFLGYIWQEPKQALNAFKNLWK